MMFHLTPLNLIINILMSLLKVDTANVFAEIFGSEYKNSKP